ncbi:MAG: ribonuclease J [Bacilli bacterium]|nr:ribonuclease J [Bacilli bacterium]
MNFFDDNDTKVFALGGLGEVGKNMYCVMHDDEIIIIDAGVAFPEDELLGIDYVIPDFSFLKSNQDKIKALVITHGHEDHIGGIPFLLQTVKIPVIYATKQATGLIKKKLEERNIKYKNFQIYDDKTKIKYKYLGMEFFRTTHSIPDSHGIVIHTPNGTIVMTGDFKFDWTPIGPVADVHKMAEIGKRGVRLLLSDSTNALVEGVSMSESRVDEALGEIIKRHNGRIIIATFASNVYRLKHIVETCRKNNRKIAVFGRSMETQLEIGINCGYIKADDVFIDSDAANKLPNNQIAILCTGSQGEPLAALSRIADGSHKQIQLMPDDVVIFSSSPIPGNSKSISRTINKLFLKGVEVYTNTMLNEIHSSGHAPAEELKLMIRLFQPEYVCPYHGEYRMLKKHADIAVECGLSKKNTFVLDNGDILSMGKKDITKKGTVPAADVYVDGSRIGDVGSIVIKDRKLMSNDGILVIIANIDVQNKILLSKPNITTRGFILINENEELIRQIENISNTVLKNNLKNNRLNYQDLKSELIQEIAPFVYDKTGRKPIILPVIMDIKNK